MFWTGKHYKGNISFDTLKRTESKVHSIVYSMCNGKVFLEDTTAWVWRQTFNSS